MLLTPEQERAVTAGKGPVVVAAGAGTGKTTVLTARVLRHVARGVSLSRLVVVTFTEKAAAEMRSRIAERLWEAQAEGWAAQALAELPEAPITTIHGYCLRLLSEHWQEAGLAPDVRVGEPHRLRLLRQRAVDEALGELYQTEDGRKLLLAFAELGGDAPLVNLLLGLLGFLEVLVDPEAWLARLEDTDLEPVFAALVEAARRDAARAEALFREAAQLAELAGWTEGARAIRQEAEIVHGLRLEDAWTGLRRALQGIGFPRLPRRPEGLDDAHLDSLRRRAKQRIEDWRKLFQTFADDDFRSWEEDERLLRRSLARAVRNVREGYQRAKAAAGLLDFADLERQAYRLLGGVCGPSHLAQGLHRQIVEVLVDEVQDVNPLQEAILALLVRPDGQNLFLVGDVKQSIFGFRHAAPELLVARLNGAGGTVVHLRDNFRSSPPILEAVHQVFRRLWPEAEGLYGRQDVLRPARPAASLPDRPAPLEARLLRRRGYAEEGWLAQELRSVAEHLRQLVDKEGVFDPSTKSVRPLRFGDVAILFRTLQPYATDALSVLTREGVPAIVEAGGRGILGQPEVALLLALLALAAGAEDNRTVATWLRAPWRRMTTEDLVSLWQAGGGSLLAGLGRQAAEGVEAARGALVELERWRRYADQPAWRVLDRILRDTELSCHLATEPLGRLRLANVHRLASLAEQPSYRTLGPLAFVQLVTELIESGGELPAVVEGTAGGAVRLLTFHAAKGLEFPVVYVVGLGQPLDPPSRSRGDAAWHATLGLGLTPRLPEGRRRRGLRHRAILAAEAWRARQEEARLLYVAMTRARDRLVLVGTLDRVAPPWPERDLVSGERYLDWILPVMAAEGWPYAVEDPLPSSATSRSNRWPALVAEGEALTRRLAVVGLPATPRRRVAHPELTLPGLRRGGRQIGSWTHWLLANLPLVPPPCRDSLEAFLRKAVARGRLPEAAWAIDREAILAFFATELGRRILAEPEGVRREAPLLYFEKTGAGEALVAGTVDLLFLPRSGRPVVVDFKTDHVGRQDVAERLTFYRPQLLTYGRGLEAAIGTFPELYCYFLAPRLLISVEESAGLP